MDYLPICLRIEQVLKEQRIGKLDFYKDVGISQSTFPQWKNGVYKPAIENLEKIADYLGVSLQWLMFGGDDDIKNAPADDDGGGDRCKLSADEWELIAAYRDFNAEGQADARKHLFVMQQSGIYKNDRKSRLVAGE